MFVTPVLDDAGEDEGGPDGSDAAGDGAAGSAQPWADGVRVPCLQGPRRGRRLVRKGRKSQAERKSFTADQRLLMLDTWQRSGLPGGDFSALVGVSKHTLYAWKKKFEEHGPAGLADRPRGGRRGSRLPEVTKRSILMIKQSNPEYGVQRISDMLLRGPGLPASPSAVARVLHEAGYELDHVPTKRHPDKVRRFERAKPNQLWQTDIFTFVLKRQNRRVHLVAFMDDHSRFITGYGLHASASGALVLQVLRAGIASYGTPEEVLTDNGTPKEPFYLAGSVGGKPVSVYSEGERLVMKQGNDEAKEVELVSPKAQEGAELPEHVCPAGVVGEESTATPGYEEPPAPGTSPLDAGLEALSEALGDAPDDAASTEQDGGVR